MSDTREERIEAALYEPEFARFPDFVEAVRGVIADFRTARKGLSEEEIKNRVSNTIGFTFEPGETQEVNASDLIRLATVFAEFRLPLGHTVIEAAEGWNDMMHQTVRIDRTGFEYERIVHQDEAYGSEPATVCDDEGCPHYGTPHGHSKPSVFKPGVRDGLELAAAWHDSAAAMTTDRVGREFHEWSAQELRKLDAS